MEAMLDTIIRERSERIAREVHAARGNRYPRADTGRARPPRGPRAWLLLPGFLRNTVSA